MKDSSTAIVSDGKSMLYAKADKGSAVAGGSLGAAPSAGAFPAEEAFQKAMSDFRRRASSRAPDGATLAIPTADAIFRTEFLPSTDPEELAAMTLNQAERDAPLPMEEMTQSFEILALEEDGALTLSVCAPSAVIEGLRSATGLDIAKVERVDALVCGTIALLLSRGGLSGRGREILFAEEGDNATLAILDSGAPVFIRSLGDMEALTPADAAKALRLALIQASARRGEGEVSGFVLLGAPERLSRFAGAAQAVAPDVRARILADDLPGGEAAGVASRTIQGAALNLFPSEWRASLDEGRFRRHFRLSIFAGLAAWFLLTGYLWGWPALIDQRSRGLEERIRRNEAAENKVRDVRNRIRIIERYSDRTLSPLEALLAVATSIKPGVDLTQFRYDEPHASLIVEGKAIATTSVYSFMDALQESPLFLNVRLSSGPTMNTSLQRYTFALSIGLKTAAPDASAQGRGGNAP